MPNVVSHFDFSRFILHMIGFLCIDCLNLEFRWVKLSGTELLPGDVVSIGRSTDQSGENKSVPADMLILAGSAIVNEAILTGESTPQWKVVFYLFFSHFFGNKFPSLFTRPTKIVFLVL